jgi:hypothetical protein
VSVFAVSLTECTALALCVKQESMQPFRPPVPLHCYSTGGHTCCCVRCYAAQSDALCLYESGASSAGGGSEGTTAHIHLKDYYCYKHSDTTSSNSCSHGNAVAACVAMQHCCLRAQYLILHAQHVTALYSSLRQTV